MNKLLGTKFYFIGIGGIGMCGLAELMHNLGAEVRGSDLSDNEQTQRLKTLGIKVYSRHSADQLEDAEVVVYSSAIKPNNPELQEAHRRKVPVIGRAEALSEIMQLKRGVAIAGTHGKTTTTSMVASMMIDSDMDPTVIVGGKVERLKATAQLGSGEWLVAEADESDGSFHRLSPEIIVITNIDNDHLDFYKNFASIQKAFLDFAAMIPFYGTLIVCGDDEKTRQLFKNFPKKVLFYGTSIENDYTLKKQGSKYQVISDGELLCEFVSPLPGEHNALNALATMLTGVTVGLEWPQVAAQVEKFSGVARRFQYKGEGKNGALVFDDYAHHPTEVKAVLQGFKEKYGDKKLHVLFQPHRYTRFQECWQDFLDSFKLADEIYVFEVYPAGEEPIAGVTGLDFYEQLQHPQKHYVEKKQDLIPRLEHCQQTDVIVTLGAGDLWRYGEGLVSDE